MDRRGKTLNTLFPHKALTLHTCRLSDSKGQTTLTHCTESGSFFFGFSQLFHYLDGTHLWHLNTEFKILYKWKTEQENIWFKAGSIVLTMGRANTEAEN